MLRGDDQAAAGPATDHEPHERPIRGAVVAVREPEGRTTFELTARRAGGVGAQAAAGRPVHDLGAGELDRDRADQVLLAGEGGDVGGEEAGVRDPDLDLPRVRTERVGVDSLDLEPRRAERLVDREVGATEAAGHVERREDVGRQHGARHPRIDGRFGPDGLASSGIL